MERSQNMELRSEKVRSVFTKIPPLLTRIGVIANTCVIIFIVSLMYYIPYCQTKDIQVNIEEFGGIFFARAEVDVKNVQQIQIGQNAGLTLHYIDGDLFFYGVVDSIAELNGKATILIKIAEQERKTELALLPTGEAKIIVSEAPLLKRIINID